VRLADRFDLLLGLWSRAQSGADSRMRRLRPASRDMALPLAIALADKLVMPVDS